MLKSLGNWIDSLSSNAKILVQICCVAGIVGYILAPSSMIYLVLYIVVYIPVFFFAYILSWSFTKHA